ncbi:hypothetical protein H5202_11805 [Shewanella sp. SG41-4]|uniref:hypothetical protein n=1 Tax=Shewanella sp. SG41-4 TaxID=2760976 RepID=UPI0016029A7D|nr:hypothetical protein [Shewanella sp. SG41-4]MBB1439352.1 hypothetical protein [Shewanella sp. SG41-4]
MQLTHSPDTNQILKINLGFGPSEDAEQECFVGDKIIKEDYLVINIDIPLNVAFAINLDSVAKFPIQLEYSELLNKINHESLILFEMDWPQEALMDLDSLPEHKRNKALERYQVIEPLLQDLDNVLRNDYGQNCIAKVIEQTGRSKQYVYDCLYSYFRLGQRRAGLCLPMGKNTIHVPKKRELRVKPGRPNTGIARGKVLDEYDYKNFKSAKRLYAKRNGPSITYVYKQLIRKHYYSSRVKHDFQTAQKTQRRFKVELKAPDQRPTYNQFYYWLCKEFDGNLPTRDKSRQNPIENQKDNSGREGDAYAHVIAPGQVFEIDETPFTEELVSVFDPTRSTKIGKATVYFIIDVFSKLIAGLYITTENPSYNTVRQAIFNSSRDKQVWFDEMGLNFDASFWPQSGIATTYFVDKAEFHNKISEGPISDLPVTVKFSRSGRGDDKPNVEQLFGIFQEYFKGVSKGNQTKSQQDIARQLARKNACLTVHELYQIAIVYVFYHNNNRIIPNYPLERSMVRDQIPAIPAKLWAWAEKNRPGYLISLPDDELYLKLLTKGEITVHRDHLYLKEKGLRYNCEWTLESGLQERKLPNQRSLILSCRYNIELVDIIFICTSDGLKIATLDHKDNRFAGLSFDQVKQQKTQEHGENELVIEDELQYLLGVQLFIEHKLTQAEKEKISGTMPSLAKIKDNRKLEALINRQSDVNRYLQTLHSQSILEFSQNSDVVEDGEFEHKAHSAFYKQENK